MRIYTVKKKEPYLVAEVEDSSHQLENRKTKLIVVGDVMARKIHESIIEVLDHVHHGLPVFKLDRVGKAADDTLEGDQPRVNVARVLRLDALLNFHVGHLTPLSV